MTQPAPGIDEHEVVALASRLIGARRCSLLLPGTERSALRIVAAIGIPDEIVESTIVRAGVGIAGLVLQTRQPLLINGDHPHLRLHASTSYCSSSFISVPVPFEPYGCGVLNVADPLHGDSFSRDDLAALQSFAALVSRGLTAKRGAAEERRIRDETARLYQEIITAQELERARLARELHDEAGHALATAIFRLDLEARALPPDGPAAHALARVRSTMMECAETLHGLAFSLHPRILSDLGLIPALRSLIAQIEEIGGLQITFTARRVSATLRPDLKLAAFRVVQEALNNVRKHAQTDRAWVTLDTTDDTLELTIEDGGIGLGVDLPLPEHRVTLGIGGMRERVELLGGRFVLESRDQGGLIVRASFPIRGEADAR